MLFVFNNCVEQMCQIESDKLGRRDKINSLSHCELYTVAIIDI